MVSIKIDGIQLPVRLDLYDFFETFDPYVFDIYNKDFIKDKKALEILNIHMFEDNDVFSLRFGIYMNTASELSEPNDIQFLSFTAAADKCGGKNNLLYLMSKSKEKLQ